MATSENEQEIIELYFQLQINTVEYINFEMESTKEIDFNL